MVYDCFPFFNELDILKLRLSILDKYVDRFVIEEARYTFSGQPKKLCFEQNKEMFGQWLDKIDYIVVDDLGEGLVPHLRDKFQKNHLIQGLSEASDTDVILLSDVDEIPNPDALLKIIEDFNSDKIYHLAQRLFYCYLNMEEVSGKLLSITGEFEDEYRLMSDGKTVEHPMWLGTKVFSKKNIPEDGMILLREISPNDSRSIRVSNGGWHFGYMGSHREMDVSKRIGEKIIAAAHQEYNTEDILKEAKDRIILGYDMFGRDSKFIRTEIDETYPEYIRNNLIEYDYLIMPKVSSFGKRLISIKMKTLRFFRRARRFVKRKLTTHHEQ